MFGSVDGDFVFPSVVYSVLVGFGARQGVFFTSFFGFFGNKFRYWFGRGSDDFGLWGGIFAFGVGSSTFFVFIEWDDFAF